MIEVPSILTRLTAWRRGPAIVGLVALALLHVSAAAHQYEHSVDQDVPVCEACGAYSQLENAAVPVAPKEQIRISSDVAAAASVADTYEVPVAAAYHSRAPPLS